MIKNTTSLKNWKNVIVLFIKALIILLLLNLADILYSYYNPSYISVGIIKFNYLFYFTIVGILLFKQFYIKIGLFLLILLSMLFQYLHYQYFGTYIQPISFYQFIMNTGEVFSSFLDEIENMIIPILIIILISLFIIILDSFKKNESYKNNIFAITILLSLVTYSFVNTYDNLHLRYGILSHKQALQLSPLPKKHSAVNFLKSLNYFLIGILPKKILNNQGELFPVLDEPVLVQKNIHANIVFIIGESLRAKQLHLLGYKLQNTPNLEKIDNLYSSTIFAAGTMTKSAVSAILNRVKYPGNTKQMVSMTNNLFYLAKKNNFTTYFYSQQSNSQLAILQSYLGLKYIDNYASREILKKKLKNAKDYDMLLKQSLETIDLMNKNNFIVLHMRGSHLPYKKQYPKSFNKFKLYYNNTVLYTDNVLSEIIKYLKENSRKPTYFIFTSDHGELLGEYGRYGHGWLFPEVYKVPFIFYTINTIKKLPLKNIQSHFQISNLIASLLGYNIKVEKMDTIYVNGSDIDALAGYLKIKIDKNNKEVEIQFQSPYNP